MDKLSKRRGPISSSKLANRLVPIFVAVVAAPLIATVLFVGHVGQEQIAQTAHTMQAISQSEVQAAGKQFQVLGSVTLLRSVSELAGISRHASQAVASQGEKNQAESLATTRDEFSRVTQASFDGAMHQSLSTNKGVLSAVSNHMGNLFASSAHYTEAIMAAKVQTAILAQIDTQMQERARQLSQVVTDYVQTNVNYLALTAQMINLYQGNTADQKAVLDALVRRMPMLTVVSVLDSSGQETAMSASDYVVAPGDMSNRKDTPYFQTAITDQPYVGVDAFPADGSAPTLRLAVPIELYRGKATGVLAARLSLSDLWDIIRNTHIGTSGFAYVTSPKVMSIALHRRAGHDLISQSAPIDSLGWNVVVAQPRQEVMAPIESFKSDIATNTDDSLLQMHSYIARSSTTAGNRLQERDADLRSTMLAQVQTSTRRIFDRLRGKSTLQTDGELAQMQQAIRSQAQVAQTEQDQQMIAAAKTASHAVAQNLPQLTAHALRTAMYRLSMYGLIIIVVSCCLSFFIALLVANAIVQPIVQLAEGTKAVAQGDLARRVDERAPAEIGDLAVAFNTMAAGMQKSRRDLSEAESQLVQSAKLASLGTLSAGVAHELNQPVAIVRGVAQQLRREPGLSDAVREDLALIEGQTGRMVKIIKHLRTFCRIGGAEASSVDVNQVIQDCFILIGAQLKVHEVAVELRLCDGSPLVRGDANELEQVFINLVTNAQDAMEGRANATITIRSYTTSSGLTVEFSDNGPGIPEKVAAHIFDPFFTTKEPGKGTGLGLSISHSIIQKHLGSISVRNDHGAIFSIVLPLEADSTRRLEAIALNAAYAAR